MSQQSAVDLTPDWNARYRANLQAIQTITGILALVLVMVTSTISSPETVIFMITPWVLLFVVQLLMFILSGRSQTLAALITLLSFDGVFALLYLTVTPEPLLLTLFVIPVLLTPLVLRDAYLLAITPVSLACMVLLSLQQQPDTWFSLQLLIPPGLALLVAAVSAGVNRKVAGLVQWAVESQSRNFIRAESFYAQREELNEALLDLQKTHTQLEQVNTRLAEARRRADEANNAKSTFLSNVSHELRAPLNMILGYTSSMLNIPEMYDGQELPDIFKDDIQLINTNGKYLLTLINDLLDLSKIEAGRLELEFVAFDIRETFQGVIATSLGLVKEKPIQIVPDYPQTLPPVRGDPVRIRQILLNLLSNGVKYTETGSVTLTARVEASQLYIAITDTGMGIPEDMLETIFERFGQVKQNSQIQGTGLGLDISQRLASLHDTRINIESTVGKGSTFSFYLPLATPEQIATAQEGSQTKTLANRVKIFNTSEQTWDRYSVLIAEDDGHMRTMLYRLFDAGGFVTFETHDGNQVIELAQGILPDLLVFNVNLPRVNGWQILRTLRDHTDTAGMQVVVLGSAASVPPDDTLADSYLTKPVAAEHILGEAKQLLAAR